MSQIIPQIQKLKTPDISYLTASEGQAASCSLDEWLWLTVPTREIRQGPQITVKAGGGTTAPRRLDRGGRVHL